MLWQKQNLFLISKSIKTMKLAEKITHTLSGGKRTYLIQKLFLNKQVTI